MKKLSLALDWTPNINHIGFLVAQDLGFYRELGIEVDILDPSTDNYHLTPAKKVELGIADFALCPTESIISYRPKKKPFDLIAIAAVLQEDLSALVVKRDAGIHSPKDLDGKIYSSYRARYEDAIVREMIKNDGGTGNIEIIYPDKLGIWNTLLEGKADATWIFLNWEGVEADASSHELTYFNMRDYGIPYGYSPVIAASESRLLSDVAAYSAFIQASKKGFLTSQSEPDTAVAILRKYVPASDQQIDLHAALAVSAPHFGDEANWGSLASDTITTFLEWIYQKEIETHTISLAEMATDRCL